MIRFTIGDKTERVSEIVCAENALQRAAECGGRKFVFTDKTVLSLYGTKIKEAFPAAEVFAMDAGEEHKTEKTLFALLSVMANAALLRGDTLVCVGGGVVCDLGGLAAALYMRGIECIYVPTTLLAQVDASVGGKTAIDFCGIKNLVGLFRQPRFVFVDPAFLGTLPVRELKCGLGEIVKHAALSAPLFEKLTQNSKKLLSADFLAEIVPDNIAIKREIVERDAREENLRKCLNLGHTTGHAIELSLILSHGECVLYGLLFEAEIALRKFPSQCDKIYLEAYKTLVIKALGGIDREAIKADFSAKAKLDKKNRAREAISFAAPVKREEYALFELPYEEYAREITKIKEALC